MVREYMGKKLVLKGTAYIAEDADLIGDIELADGVSVWYGSVLRGDSSPIRLGENVNIQDLTVIHGDSGFPTIIGNNCLVGHRAILHSCVIGDGTLIGMGAVIMTGAQIGEGCVIGAGALVTEGKVIPPNSLVMGIPGRIVRETTAEDREKTLEECASYRVCASRQLPERRAGG